jgi:outer membrane murein-binding lipoprotein Lpp
MKEYALLIKLVLAAVLLALVYWAGGNRVQKNWNLDVAEQGRAAAEVITNALTANSDLIKALEIQKNEAQTRIDNLAADNRSLRVRLPQASNCGQATAAGGGIPRTPSGELLPDASADPQAALDRFMAEADEDAESSSKQIESCRVVDEWAKAQAPKK